MMTASLLIELASCTPTSRVLSCFLTLSFVCGKQEGYGDPCGPPTSNATEVPCGNTCPLAHPTSWADDRSIAEYTHDPALPLGFLVFSFSCCSGQRKRSRCTALALVGCSALTLACASVSVVVVLSLPWQCDSPPPWHFPIVAGLLLHMAILSFAIYSQDVCFPAFIFPRLGGLTHICCVPACA